MAEPNAHFDSWNDLYEALFPTLHRGALRLANGNWANADELVQESFCSAIAYTKVETLKEPLRYMRTVLKRTWIKRRRRIEISLQEINLSDLKLIVMPKNRLKLEHIYQMALATYGPFTRKEKLLLEGLCDGLGCEEMAILFNEDVNLVRHRWEALKKKIQYRRKQRGN